MDPMPAQMVITGERTVPNLWHENYWFRRHEVVYEELRTLVAGQRVLEAGCGEGYGAALLAASAAHVTALDYDAYAVGHVAATYPEVSVVRGNLVALPLPDDAVDVVVSLQTIEHLWGQPAFVAECLRVTRPGGHVVISTPNTLTFPPGNPFHPHELTPDELHDLVAPHADVVSLRGLGHGPRIQAWEQQHGSIVDRQIADPWDQWPGDLVQQVTSVTTTDFVLSPTDLDTSLDLVLVARAR